MEDKVVEESSNFPLTVTKRPNPPTDHHVLLPHPNIRAEHAPRQLPLRCCALPLFAVTATVRIPSRQLQLLYLQQEWVPAGVPLSQRFHPGERR